MKRQIKFRGKRLDNEEWCQGYYTFANNTHTIQWENEDGAPWWADVNPDTIGQSSGLTDCNGKEIYEGDLLECHKLRRPPFEVYYNTVQGAFCLIERTFKGTVLHGKEAIGRVLGVFPDMVVIGNIHDNPIEE